MLPPHTALQRHFITVRGQFGTREVHFRRGGQGPVVLLLHQSPQSSREMEPLIEAWGQAFTVFAPDSPGYGLSQPLQRGGRPVASATIDDFAAATLEFADALGLGRFGIYGFHTGASIGVALADTHPARVAAVAANGFVVLTDDERTVILREYLPPLVPRWDGGHLAWLWGRMREQIIFFPWHDRRAATRMSFPMPSATQLQQGVNEFLAAGDHYHVAYAAAFSDRGERRLPALRVPLLITAAARDPLAAHLSRIGGRSDTVRIVSSTDAAMALRQAQDHLASHPGDGCPPGAGHERDASKTPLVGASEYCGPPGRQVRVIRSGRGAVGKPLVLLLHPPGSSAESLGALVGTLAPHADVLVPDLPGHGASDGLAPADGSALAGTVTRLLTALAPVLAASPAASGTTLVAIGSSAPVAIELAAGLGRSARVLLLDPPAWSAADADEWQRSGLPAMSPVWSGGHLLEAWHLVRDSRLFSPWFRREPAGMRRGEPDLDDRRIQRDVRDLLRANGAWQPLMHDVLGYSLTGGTTSGPGIATLDSAPETWAEILAPPGHDPSPS